MKKVLYRHLFSKVLGLTLLLFSTSFYAQEETEAAADVATEETTDATGGDPVNGKQLFNQNCAACHSLDRKMTGPALANVETRLAEDEGLDKEWIYSWVKNSPAMISSGDSYANKIYAEYNQAAMTPFPTLSNEDIDDILAYTAAPPPAPAAAAATAAAGGEATGSSSGISNEMILGALALVFGLLVIMLILVNKTLRRIAEANGVVLEQEKEKRLPIWKAFVQNQFLVLVTVIFLLLGSAYFAYGYLMQVGVDQGYAPVQPIHFSHKIHAGDNNVDCKYCHSSARVSKTSGIPSLNVCMNCHKSIYEYTGNPEGPSAEDLAAGHTNEFYTGEIKKLYKAVGW
ncbi:MAG: c-type cytochrome, partial [Bacteroidota bacterium]|nr:c-type cytochrome [Bacteroidota bacterium]